MTDITPADLAKFIHPVPVGATIPAGMERVVLDSEGRLGLRIWDHDDVQPETGWDETGMYYDAPCWTAEPLTAPKPPLPTEVGAVIANAVPLFGGRDPEPSDTCAVMVLSKHGQWLGVDANGYARSYASNEIIDWTPARIVTDEADR